MRPLLRCVSAFFAAMAMASAAHAAPQCATQSEADAIHMRILQTDLMVAGLSCQLRNDYAHFVRVQKRHLAQHGAVLKDFFLRTQGSTAAMDRFITGLANGASSQSLQRNQSNYCTQAQWFFREVNQTPHQMLLAKLANTPDITARRRVPLCAQTASAAAYAPYQALEPRAAKPTEPSAPVKVRYGTSPAAKLRRSGPRR